MSESPGGRVPYRSIRVGAKRLQRCTSFGLEFLGPRELPGGSRAEADVCGREGSYQQVRWFIGRGHRHIDCLARACGRNKRE